MMQDGGVVGGLHDPEQKFGAILSECPKAA
jgi:hypothetical protein